MKFLSMLVKPDINVITDPDERQRRIQTELDDFLKRESEEIYEKCYEGVGRAKIYTGQEAQQRRASRMKADSGGLWHSSGFSSTSTQFN